MVLLQSTGLDRYYLSLNWGQSPPFQNYRKGPEVLHSLKHLGDPLCSGSMLVTIYIFISPSCIRPWILTVSVKILEDFGQGRKSQRMELNLPFESFWDTHSSMNELVLVPRQYQLGTLIPYFLSPEVIITFPVLPQLLLSIKQDSILSHVNTHLLWNKVNITFLK